MINFLYGETDADDTILVNLYPNRILETSYLVVEGEDIRFFDADKDTVHVFKVIKERVLFINKNDGECNYLFLKWKMSEQLSKNTTLADIIFQENNSEDDSEILYLDFK